MSFSSRPRRAAFASIFLLLVLTAFRGGEAPPVKARYQVVDTMPAFWEFWRQAGGRDSTTQLRLFDQLLVQRYPELYNREVLGGPRDKTFAEVLPRRYGLVMKMVEPKMPIVQRLSAQIGRDLPRYESRFRRTFPDLDYAGQVYFMFSLGGFDGATRTVKGQEALLFGLDMMAHVYGSDVDPEPFFDHEFFHVYHSQFFDEPEGIITSLWREGLATYVAHRLNPKAAGVNLFGLPRNTPERTRADQPRYARELLAVLDSKSDEDYARYFMGQNEQAATPSRSGYYLGYLVAEKLGRRHSLPELAHAPLSKLRPEIEAALQELAAAK